VQMTANVRRCNVLRPITLSAKYDIPLLLREFLRIQLCTSCCIKYRFGINPLFPLCIKSTVTYRHAYSTHKSARLSGCRSVSFSSCWYVVFSDSRVTKIFCVVQRPSSGVVSDNTRQHYSHSVCYMYIQCSVH